jgi:hypothetical protein
MSWVIREESVTYLVMRCTSEGGDIRIAFAAGKGAAKNYGSGPYPAGTETGTIVRFDKWGIHEENGVLVVRDHQSPTDNRYAFWPGNGNEHNFGSGTPATKHNEVLFRGQRWIIAVENGILVFRDTLSGGDHRYAFFPSYVDL